MLKYGVNTNLFDKIIEEISKVDKVKKIILYGSRAKGNYKTGSDIDLTISGNNLKLRDILNIHLKLEELYLPYNIDLSIYENIENKDLIDHINRIGILVYEKRQ